MEKELEAILKLKIPKTIKRPIGFLEIAKIAHHENIISSIYSYFLNSKNKELANVFKDALTSVINSKLPSNEKHFKKFSKESFNIFKSNTEIVVDDKKRIDLDIVDKENNSVIIIENKIYHHLNNDLEKYYKHYPTKNKILVLLTLEQFDFTTEKSTIRSLNQAIDYRNKNQLVAITHKEWIEAIKIIKLPTGLKNQEYVYLNDFFNSIDNLTKNLNMTEEQKFYFNHIEQINKASKVKEKAKNHVINQISFFTKKYNHVHSPKGDWWLNIFKKDKNSQPFYGVNYDGLFKNRSLRICITVVGDCMKNIYESDDIKNKINEIILNSENKVFSDPKIQYRRFMYLFEKDYTELSDHNISKLSDFLTESIIKDFKPLMLQLDEILSSETNVINSDWFPKKI